MIGVLANANEGSSLDNNDDTEFQTPKLLPDWNDDRPFEKHMNRTGVVYVHLLAAQRLPCPVGSSVCASISLPPWQGRVRPKRTLAFSSSSSFDDGVCVSWKSKDGFCSMVNAWSSDDSPVPSIRVELTFSPLGIGLFEFTICTLELSCEVLMKSPGLWKEQWCQAQMSDSGSSAASSGIGTVLIHLKAMFKPEKDTVDSPVKLSRKVTQNDDLEAEMETPSVELDRIKEREIEEQTEEIKQRIEEAMEEETVEFESFTEEIIEEETKEMEPTEQEFAEIEGNNKGSEDSREEKDDLPTDRENLLPDVPTIDSKSAESLERHEPHHLRLVSYWVPASCGVCSKVLFGRNNGFHCEECSIECCSDCRLHVDLRLPCGSEAARAVAENIERTKMSLDNILSIVAPDEGFARTKELEEETKSIISERETVADSSNAIGCMKLKFIRAVLRQQVLPSESDPSIVFVETSSESLRQGDYYARISISGSTRTARTPTIQNTGMPKFGSVPMKFYVDDYSREFRLDVVDASTDRIVGTNVFSTQEMLQNQRDMIIQKDGVNLFQAFEGPLEYRGTQRLKLELRTGINNGFGSAFFVPPKRKTENTSESSGGIIGFLEVEAGLEEYVQKLYKTSYACPPKPARELNMANFQMQLQRITSLVEDFKDIWKQYKYIISWKDPEITALALFCFVTLCMRFNAEYCGSLPFLGILLWMLQLSSSRREGGRKKRYIRKEIEIAKKAGAASLTYSLHRPVGGILVSVTQGSSLLSHDGIPGKASCHILWDPLKYMEKASKKSFAKVDKASESIHKIGFTDARYTADPKWDMYESLGTRRLKQLLPSEEGLFKMFSDFNNLKGLCFPVLQPFALNSQRKDSKGRFIDVTLNEWDTSPGAIVCQVRFQDLLLGLGLEHVLGEVVIPLSEVVRKGRIEGWFKLSDGKDVSPFMHYDKQPIEKVLNSERSQNHSPSIFLSLLWIPPNNEKHGDDTDIELSFVIQEELVRSSVMKKQEGFDLVESSLGAVNTALGFGGNLQEIQNSLSFVLDLIESVLNLINFTDPFKSSFLFFSIFIVFLLFLLIPSRVIILCAGLTQFALALEEEHGLMKKAFPKGSNIKPATYDESDGDHKNGNPAIWMLNALRSLPTMEDLRRTYFWESKRRGYQESEKFAAEKRESRLRQLWKAKWYSHLRILVHDISGGDSHWTPVFAVIQGHNFLWWNSVQDFDNGEVPSGRLFLSGHAGLTGPSPMEMRKLSKEQLSLSVSIFGRGLDGQERVTLLMTDLRQKERLEDAVCSISAKDD